MHFCILGQCFYGGVGILQNTNIVIGSVQCGQKLVHDTNITQTIMCNSWHEPLFTGKNSHRAGFEYLEDLF